MADNYLITGYWGEPHVTAENDRGINAAMFGPGRVVLPVGEQFKAEYIGNNTVRMYDGKLLDNGAAAGIPVGEYVDLLIANAGQGMKRNDLIVFQYKQDSSTLIESGTFVVIQGEETSGTAYDPTLTQGDLLTGKATFDQMALWRVSVSGATISAPVQVFSVRSMHIYWGSYKGNIDNTDLNGLYWIATANCTGTFPSGMATSAYLEATGRYQKLTYYSNNGVSCIQERYYANNHWFAWQRTDSLDSAPAGYGLGISDCININSFKNITKNGWWISDNDTPGSWWRCLATVTNGGNDIVLDAWSLDGKYNAKLSKNGGNWGEWEWVNPPMALEVEYRTTERLHNLPVYAKLVDFGSAPNNTTKSVAHGISNIKNIAEWHCYNLNGGTSLDQATTVTAITVNNTNINVTTSANEAAWHMRFIIKYTKTTD